MKVGNLSRHGGQGFIGAPLVVAKLGERRAQRLRSGIDGLPFVALVLQKDRGNGLRSLGYVRSIHEADDRRHGNAPGRAAQGERCDVTRPGVGRTVARQDDHMTIRGVEKGQGPHMTGLPDGLVDGLRVGRERSLSGMDCSCLLLGYERVARATDDQQRETHERNTRAQHLRGSLPWGDPSARITAWGAGQNERVLAHR